MNRHCKFPEKKLFRLVTFSAAVFFLFTLLIIGLRVNKTSRLVKECMLSVNYAGNFFETTDNSFWSNYNGNNQKIVIADSVGLQKRILHALQTTHTHDTLMQQTLNKFADLSLQNQLSIIIKSLRFFQPGVFTVKRMGDEVTMVIVLSLNESMRVSLKFAGNPKIGLVDIENLDEFFKFVFEANESLNGTKHIMHEDSISF